MWPQENALVDICSHLQKGYGSWGNKRPGQIAVQGQHGMIETLIVAVYVGVHHIQLAAQVVPKLARAALLVEPAEAQHNV